MGRNGFLRRIFCLLCCGLVPHRVWPKAFPKHSRQNYNIHLYLTKLISQSQELCFSTRVTCQQGRWYLAPQPRSMCHLIQPHWSGDDKDSGTQQAGCCDAGCQVFERGMVWRKEVSEWRSNYRARHPFMGTQGGSCKRSTHKNGTYRKKIDTSCPKRKVLTGNIG